MVLFSHGAERPGAHRPQSPHPIYGAAAGVLSQRQRDDITGINVSAALTIIKFGYFCSKFIWHNRPPGKTRQELRDGIMETKVFIRRVSTGIVTRLYFHFVLEIEMLLMPQFWKNKSRIYVYKGVDNVLFYCFLRS